MNRSEILQEAQQIVNVDRNSAYGDPEDNFAVIANLWTDYLIAKGLFTADQLLEVYDIATLMILMKVSRLVTSPEKEDHWIDIAGYAACGGGLFDERHADEETD